MIDLRNKTITDGNIMFNGKYYRYVNHEDKLLTTGFGTKDGLIRNKDLIRFDKLTIQRMQDRYNDFYGV